MVKTISPNTLQTVRDMFPVMHSTLHLVGGAQIIDWSSIVARSTFASKPKTTLVISELDFAQIVRQYIDRFLSCLAAW